MKSLRTFQKISCIMLGLSIAVSAHAFHVKCGQEFGPDRSGEVVKLDRNLVCSSEKDNPDFAIQISGVNIQFLLNGHSIAAAPDSPPDIGIYITGDNNRVTGPGKVAGFEGSFPEGNIVIENANDNHVSQLRLEGGDRGVVIVASDPMSNADSNEIYLNSIRGSSTGINLFNLNSSKINRNEIYTNLIRDVQNGIFITGNVGGRVVGNNIYANTIKLPTSTGITVLNQGAARFEGNRFNDNRIEDPPRGIIVSSSNTTLKQNFFIKNRIIRPRFQAIALDPFGTVGLNTLNLIANNISDENESVLPVYCDSTGQTNIWQINFIGLIPQLGVPGDC